MSSLPPIAPLMIKSADVCKLTGLGARKTWELANRNALPSVRIGAARRFIVAEVQAWVAMGCPTEHGAADRVRAAMKKGRA